MPAMAMIVVAGVQLSSSSHHDHGTAESSETVMAGHAIIVCYALPARR
jgi:hypothetical protein